jgi:hypothetical protein
MLEIIKTLVGITGVTLPGITPARLVNDLPGLHTELVESLTTEDAADLAAVWASAQVRAAQVLTQEIESRLQALGAGWRRAVVQPTQATPYRSPLYVGEFRPMYSAPQEDYFWTGVIIEIPKGAPRLALVLESFTVVTKCEDLAVAVQIIDLLDGLPADLRRLSDGAAVYPPIGGGNGEPGILRVPLGVRVVPRYDGLRLFIGIRPPQCDTMHLAPAAGLPDGITYVGYDLIDDGTLRQTETHTHVAFSVECDLGGIIERNRNLFADAVLYACGAELLRAKLYSDRTNYFAMGNLAATQDNLNGLVRKLGRALDNALRRLPSSETGPCIACDEANDAYFYNGSMTA